jgi:hypothetical protein
MRVLNKQLTYQEKIKACIVTIQAFIEKYGEKQLPDV